MGRPPILIRGWACNSDIQSVQRSDNLLDLVRKANIGKEDNAKATGIGVPPTLDRRLRSHRGHVELKATTTTSIDMESHELQASACKLRQALPQLRREPDDADCSHGFGPRR